MQTELLVRFKIGQITVVAVKPQECTGEKQQTFFTAALLKGKHNLMFWRKSVNIKYFLFFKLLFETYYLGLLHHNCAGQVT